MKLEEKAIRLKQHAWKRYCQRVGVIEHPELLNQLAASIAAGEYRYCRSLVHISGVWYAVEALGDVVSFVTCYGRTNFDLPAALSWAKRNKDKIQLGGEVLCDGIDG